MAAAIRSPLASSIEKTNGAKLSRLLIDGGTTILRNIFNGYHPPANLAAGLKANYSTLHNLLKKKVLHVAQWDQLFPPGGATPDANTFDITLLFLLLTNICGLSPPLSGWHKKPSSSDASFEANLARVKFFRNELYGHVSTTGIDTPTFSSLWQEISAVLAALGLDQVEIDRLEAEHSGEEGYLDVLLDWAESEEDIKSQLTNIQQSLTKTQQSIEEVHHTQINTRQAQETSIQDTNSMVKKVLQIQEEDHQTLQELRPTVENLIEQKRKDKENEILKKLAKIDTEKDVKTHVERYQEGTRMSIVAKVENWLDDRSSQNRVMVISGNAGMGKSVISAVICKRMQEAGRLSGSHFCQHGKARHRNPKVMLQSLACQLSDSLPEYKSAIVEILSRNLGGDINSMEVSDIFELLFEESLCNVKDPGRNILMIIDGLDESEYQGRNKLLDVIADYFCKLPSWIRFLVTTRPEINIAASLRDLNPLQLEPNNEENLQDIRVYFKERLGHAIQSEHQGTMLDRLVNKSEGVILFAYFLVDCIKNRKVSLVTPEMLDNSLPSGISDVYKSYFKRLESELHKELDITEEQFINFLCALTAARQPLPIGFLSKLMASGTASSVRHRIVNRAIACISTLLPVQDDCIHFFHKSVKDWLTETSSYGQHDFTVDLKEGHGILSELCSVELDNVKLNGVVKGQFIDTKTYALQHGVAHMLEDAMSRDSKELVRKFVLDLQLVYAKLCVNHATAAEDIVRCQKQDMSSALPEESKIHLENVLLLLRKYHDMFKHHPEVFLQTVLNEGEARLSSEASCLLREKYNNIAFMEYIHKDVHEEAPQASFPCSAAVICFDVSPQSDYMVCECKDEMLYLWSLRTGKLQWKRPVKVEKQYLSDNSTYRKLPSSNVCSCYRSVVFHPLKEVVLPGILSSAYSYDGDLKPLFPGSNCRFTVCSISNAGGEATILTNCPDDAKCIILWSLDNGLQVANIHSDEDVLSFACSLDGRMLAISHTSGSICLFDVKGLRTLTKRTIPRVCGMMKFSPDHQLLYCWHEPYPRDEYIPRNNVFRLNVERWGNDRFSLGVFGEKVSYKPYEHESASKAGFMLGDPFSCIFETMHGFSFLVERAFVFVLNKQSVLRCFPEGHCVGMFSTDVLRSFTASFFHPQVSRAEHIAFSFNGETLYVIAKGPAGRKLTAWGVPNRDHKATMMIDSTSRKCLLPVTEGVIITTDDGSPELWNFELSNRIRRWPNVRNITDVIPISGNQVACVGVRNKEVNILHTTSTGIAATIPFRHEGYRSTVGTLGRESVTLNSKHHVLSTGRHSVQLSDGTDIIWVRSWPDLLLCSYYLPGMFSPKEEFVLISGKCRESDHQDVYVLDASSGEEQRILFRCAYVFDCKFVSDEECVVDYDKDFSQDGGLRLFNVKSGDLLSVIVRQKRTYCLATCPLNHLIAIDIDGSEHNFRIIQVNTHSLKITGKRKGKLDMTVATVIVNKINLFKLLIKGTRYYRNRSKLSNFVH